MWPFISIHRLVVILLFLHAISYLNKSKVVFYLWDDKIHQRHLWLSFTFYHCCRSNTPWLNKGSFSFSTRNFYIGRCYKIDPSYILQLLLLLWINEIKNAKAVVLVAPFAFELVNYSRHSEILKFRKNSKSTSFSFKNRDFTVFKHFSKTHCASKKWSIWTQKVPKET